MTLKETLKQCCEGDIQAYEEEWWGWVAYNAKAWFIKEILPKKKIWTGDTLGVNSWKACKIHNELIDEMLERLEDIDYRKDC